MVLLSAFLALNIGVIHHFDMVKTSDEVSLSVEKLFLAKRTSRSGSQIEPDVVVPELLCMRYTVDPTNYTNVKIERWPLAQHFTIFNSLIA